VTTKRAAKAVVEKARFNSGNLAEDHFVNVSDMIGIGKGGQRPAKIVLLSRYACYLAIQNADPRKAIMDICWRQPDAQVGRRTGRLK
jgi:DNA-damage-inducible protein D